MARHDDAQGFWELAIGWFIENKLVVFLLTAMLILGGLFVSPFDTELGSLPRDPVPVDAIPDIGENQQIVFTAWPGRSPRDVERIASQASMATVRGAHPQIWKSFLDFSSDRQKAVVRRLIAAPNA